MLDLLESVLRTVLRVAQGRKAEPSATIFDSCTLQSSPESGHRAGYLPGLHVTPASEQDRAQVAQLSQQVQATTGQSVEVAFVDQGYTGGQPAQDAAQHGIRLEVVKLPEAKKGLVLLPRRWVVAAGSQYFFTDAIIYRPEYLRDYELLMLCIMFILKRRARSADATSDDSAMIDFDIAG